MFHLLFFGIISGASFPIQTCINTKLRQKIGSVFETSFISFLVSLIFLLCLLPVMQQSLDISAEKILSQPLWILSGGLCGVTVLMGNILLFPRLGSMQTVILPILGQILMGLTIDNFGLFNATEISLTLSRIAGAVMVFVGVVIISSRRASAVQSNNVQNLWMWRIFGVFIGTLTSIQTAVNSYLGVVVESPIKSSLISFLTGIIILAAICILARIKKTSRNATSDEKFSWWIWTGGICGAIIVLTNVYLGQIIGTGLTIILILTGSMIGGIVIDNFGFFGSEIKKFNIGSLIGILIILVGIGFIKI